MTDDNKTQTPALSSEGSKTLPETGAYRLEKLMPGGHEIDTDPDGERNIVFTSLVAKEGDVVGLVAYSIYKQNKHDWLLAFRRARGHEPTPGEVAAYIVGESTPRRLSTYRYLAAATLAGQGPDISAGTAGQTAQATSFKAAGRTSGSDVVARVLGAVALAAVVVIAVLLVSRFGLVAH